MSIWAEVEGLITTRKDRHVSIKSVVKTTGMKEHVLQINRVSETEDRYTSRIEWRFVADGLDAAQIIDHFVRLLKARDASAGVILNANIRWEE